MQKPILMQELALRLRAIANSNDTIAKHQTNPMNGQTDMANSMIFKEFVAMTSAKIKEPTLRFPQ